MNNNTTDKFERLRGNIFISRRMKYAFLPVTKVAGTTLKAGLWKTEQKLFPSIDDYADINELHDPAKGELWSTLHMPPYNESPVADILSERFVFTFVRNPYLRLLSCYLNKLGPAETLGIDNGDDVKVIRKKLGISMNAKISFKEFIDKIFYQSVEQMDIHWQPQWYITGIGAIKYDLVGRLENYMDDITAVTTSCFNSLPDTIFVNRLNSTSSQTKTGQYFTKVVCDQIYEIYRKDFDLFGYHYKPEKFNSIGSISKDILR